MNTYYTYDRVNYYTGDFVITKKKDKPSRSTDVVPPALDSGEYAVWSGVWTITTTAPDYSLLEIPQLKPEKRVLIKDCLLLFPANTRRMCRELIDSTNYSIPAEEASADTADVILGVINCGDAVNINSPKFEAFATWLITNTDVTQTHIDQLADI